MAAEIHATGKDFNAGIPKQLFEAPPGRIFGMNLAASADGQRFLLAIQVENEAAVPVTLLLNWAAGIQK